VRRTNCINVAQNAHALCPCDSMPGSVFIAVFGARLPADAPQVANVQVGVDAATGQPIWQQQAVQSNYHWALQHTWIWAIIIMQGVVFILFLSAMSADSWSQYSGFGILVSFGVVREHTTGSGTSGYGTITYADICSSVTGSDKQPCGTLRAAGAFTLILSLFALFNSLGMLIKASMTGCCNTQYGWATWQYQLGKFDVGVNNIIIHHHLHQLVQILTRNPTLRLLCFFFRAD
jgi:hypothetical protein